MGGAHKNGLAPRVVSKGKNNKSAGEDFEIVTSKQKEEIRQQLQQSHQERAADDASGDEAAGPNNDAAGPQQASSGWMPSLAPMMRLLSPRNSN